MSVVSAIRQIDLSNFRTYADARIEAPAGAGVLVLTGANGAGKTNVLEAISLLTPGRGLRRARPAEPDRRGGAGPWAVSALLEGPEGEVRIGIGRDPTTVDRRVARVNGAPCRSQKALGAYLNVVWLTPAMDRLFQEGASERRRFLDRLAYGFDRDHAGHLIAYERAMRQRAQVLRDGGAEPTWLEALEARMAVHGVAVAVTRRALVARLDGGGDAGDPRCFPVAGLRVQGVLDEWLAEASVEATAERFRRLLREQRRIDRERDITSAGPHRSDLLVIHPDGARPAAACSTGEQKALLVGVVLAHAALQAVTRGAAPLLLLDEATAHLDAPRRLALFQRLSELPAQIWLTGTDAETFAPLSSSARFFHVEAGQVRPIQRQAGSLKIGKE